MSIVPKPIFTIGEPTHVNSVQEKHDRKADGVLLLKPGHSIFLVNPDTLECRKAEASDTTVPVPFTAGIDSLTKAPSAKRLDIPSGWVAVPALNASNAVRKIKKLL